MGLRFIQSLLPGHFSRRPCTRGRAAGIRRAEGVCWLIVFLYISWSAQLGLYGQATNSEQANPQAPLPATGQAAAVDAKSDEQQLASAVRKLVRDLEGRELSVRDRAEKELLALGVAALPYLPEITQRTSGELKLRLQRVRQALQQTGIESFFEASRVTLHGKMPLRAALEAIEMQTKNSIKLENADAVLNVEVELEAQQLPFWAVMSSLMKQANLRINAFGSTESELVLVPGSNNSEGWPSYASGPIRMDLTSIRSALPFNSPLAGQLDVSLTLTWEPRLQPVFMQLPMSTLKALYADDQTLSASNPQATPEVPLNVGGCSTQIDLQLTRPPRETQRLDALAGEFSMAVPSQRHQYVFKKFGNGARQSEKFGDVTVNLEGARRNGAVYEIRLFVQFGNAQGALDSFRGWILSNEAYLLDARDTRIANVGLNTYAITPEAVGIAYLFQINGDPDDFRLVYESPASVTTQRFTYEFREIPLP